MFFSRRCYVILLMVLLQYARFHEMLFAVSVGKCVHLAGLCLQISGKRSLYKNLKFLVSANRKARLGRFLNLFRDRT